MRMMIALRYLMLFMSRTRFSFFFSLSFSCVASEAIERNKRVASSRSSLTFKKKNERTMEVMALF